MSRAVLTLSTEGRDDVRITLEEPVFGTSGISVAELMDRLVADSLTGSPLELTIRSSRLNFKGRDTP